MLYRRNQGKNIGTFVLEVILNGPVVTSILDLIRCLAETEENLDQTQNFEHTTLQILQWEESADTLLQEESVHRNY